MLFRSSRLNQIDPNSPEGMFCIGSMIRGGVYSVGSKKAEAEAEAKAKAKAEAETKVEEADEAA